MRLIVADLVTENNAVFEKIPPELWGNYGERPQKE
jgi:hypothetical protein